VVVPLNSSGKCASARRESCRLIVDYYFQVFPPTITKDAARIVAWVSSNAPGLRDDDTYLATVTLKLRLAKINGVWKITEAEKRPTT
jgi:hypothetical protein